MRVGLQLTFRTVRLKPNPQIAIETAKEQRVVRCGLGFSLTSSMLFG
jgi:hypothetical protein